MKHFGSWNTEEHAVNKNTPDNITWIKLDGGNNQFSAKKTQNLLKRTTFRVLLSQLVLIILMSSVAVSLILMLVGIFSDQRTCLTVGCILGLAAFGAILHGCLSHRSLPDSTTPIVLSAACMYPVGNLALTTDHNATAAAMATATFIPKTFQHPSSMMTSSLEASVLSQLQKKQSFPFPPGPTIMARQNSFHTLSIPLPYRRNVSDPVAARRSHVLDRSSEDPPVDAKVVQYTKQHSCPVEQATLNEEHLYANDLVWTGCSTAEHSDLSLNCDQTVEGMMIPKRDGIKKQTEGSRMCCTRPPHALVTTIFEISRYIYIFVMHLKPNCTKLANIHSFN
ncbi:hypothetical protein T265_08434 [Opisthorchis viverrini]|uniref:Uncharacterized protein n=1 Tax=Opisthorchis viverrini TaxID=6198 RepID=A0A074Z9G1_OPIVI|nr:hypothetical protein T265_08434 [Opisthorchis viverrini]KER23743.1 hypothetical protein T265_08434 [Opisthorchis viverrini]